MQHTVAKRFMHRKHNIILWNTQAISQKKRNLFRRSQKLVTPGSLRLGLELSGKENCIEFHPILSDCKMRNPQNLAGSVPKTPTSANILIQKKEQKSLLLEFVIPLGWSVSAPDAHRGHFFKLTLHSLMRFSTLKFQGSNMHDIATIFTMQPKNNSLWRTRTAR